MRALALILPLLVSVVASAEPSHVQLRLVADDKPPPRNVSVTGVVVVPAPPTGIAALTRMESLAARVAQPRVAVESPKVSASVKLEPRWPLGGLVTLECRIRR